jgi:hypothetical protein
MSKNKTQKASLVSLQEQYPSIYMYAQPAVPSIGIGLRTTFLTRVSNSFVLHRQPTRTTKRETRNRNASARRQCDAILYIRKQNTLLEKVTKKARAPRSEDEKAERHTRLACHSLSWFFLSSYSSSNE